MVSNNPQFNKNYLYTQNQQHFGQMPPAANGNIPTNPAMSGQYEEPTLVNSMVGGDPKETIWSVGLTAPFLIALLKLQSLFSKSNNGAFEKSFVGKLAKFGDSKIVQNPVTKGINSVVQWTGNLCKKVVNKSKVLSAFFNTPSKPECKMVSDMLHGTKEQVASEFTNFVSKYLKAGKGTATVADLGMTEAEWSAISKNPAAYLDRIKDICNNVGSTKSVKINKLFGKLTSSTVTLEQIGNELKSLTEPTTKLGKFLPKLPIRGLYGLTFGGGVFIILSAFSMAQAAVKAKKAEKGDKLPTFMERFLGNISWIITMPLGIKLMNAVGGLRYVGKSKTQVDAIRNELNIFNTAAKGGFASKADYKAAKAALDAAKKAGNKKGFFGTIFSWAGKFVSAGREVARPYIKANPANIGEKLMNVLRKSGYYVKRYSSFPIGFALYMLAFAPIVDKLFVKASHAVFGKPKHSMYDEEPETQPTAQQDQTASQPIQHTSPTNLVNMYQNGQTYNNPTNSTTVTTNQQINNNTGDKTLEPVRTYIPSSDPVVSVNTDDTSAAEALLAKADAMEKMALDTLSIK